MNLSGKTVVITGASRGIGRAIALRLATQKANIVVAAKTKQPHPKLPGTIFSVAQEIKDIGAKALPIQVDVRSEDQVQNLVKETVDTFGGIDVLINNAGAIRLTSVDQTPMKSFDLMTSINVRAAFLCSQACLPYLKKSSNAHIINMSPPLSFNPKWLSGHVAYTISKYGMSLCTLGMSKEFEEYNIAVNSLWPKTLIDTAAVSMLMGEAGAKHSRKTDIVADAVYNIISTPASKLTGQLLMDEDFLRSKGVNDFAHYACHKDSELYPDLYIE